MKNTSAFGDIQITPLSGQFDLRSPSGTLSIYDFRLVLNASMNEAGKRCRRPGWRKYGAGSPHGFNNQDLHDRLSGLSYYCDDGRAEGCLCPDVPDCLRLADYEYGVILSNCVDGADSDAPAWDGTIRRTGDCTWGFSYGTYSFGGKDVAVVLSLASCTYGVNTFHIEITVRLDDGTGLIVWAGDSISTPAGTYARTDGCDDAESILVLENCGACTNPVLSAIPPSGSTVTAGSFMFLFATEGASIFFTTDGSTPDNTDEMYTGPFRITEDMTVKAIAYSGTCQSEVGSFAYTTIPTEDFLFEFTCDTEDQSGVFDEFDPNGSPDYNWRLMFNQPEIDIIRLEIYETNSDGVWVSGQSWATKRTIYPDELGGSPFTTYPLVLFESGSQISSGYTPAPDNLIDANPAGAHSWMMFGQPFVPLVGYFKLIFVYNEGGTEKTIYSVISHDCEDYYYDEAPPVGSGCFNNLDEVALPATLTIDTDTSAPVVMTNGGFETSPGVYQMGTVYYTGTDGVLNYVINPGLCEFGDSLAWLCTIATVGSNIVMFRGYLNTVSPLGSWTQTTGPIDDVVTS